MTLPRVLVACPTYDACGYALEDWAKAFHAFTYPAKEALQVDNSSDGLNYTWLIRTHGIPALYDNHHYGYLWHTMEMSWLRIVEYARERGCELIASIEADVICPPQTLDVLVEAWRGAGPKAIVTHRYRPRNWDPEEKVEECGYVMRTFWLDALGCALFPTELLYETRTAWTTPCESEFYWQGSQRGYELVSLRDVLDIEHRPDPKRGRVLAYPSRHRAFLDGGNPTP